MMEQALMARIEELVLENKKLQTQATYWKKSYDVAKAECEQLFVEKSAMQAVVYAAKEGHMEEPTTVRIDLSNKPALAEALKLIKECRTCESYKDDFCNHKGMFCNPSWDACESYNSGYIDPKKEA